MYNIFVGVTAFLSHHQPTKMVFYSAILALVLVCVVVLKVPQTLWGLERKVKAMRDIPGWPTHWFWGNLHQLHRPGLSGWHLLKRTITE